MIPVYQHKEVYEDEVQCKNTGHYLAEVRIFQNGRWWIVPIGPSFVNLNYSTDLKTLEKHPSIMSSDVSFRQRNGFVKMKIGNNDAIEVPISNFDAEVRRALGLSS